MSDPRNRICDRNIIGPSCRERFLPLGVPAARQLLDHHIFMGGISDLRPPYEQARAAPRFHLLLYTLAGRGKLWTEFESATLHSSTLLVAPAGSAYRYRIDGPSWRILWFHIKAREPWSEIDRRGLSFRKSNLSGSLLRAAEGFLEECSQLVSPDQGAARLYAELIEILIRRETRIPTDPAAESWRRALHLLWAEVDADLSRSWAIRDLARAVHVSPGHLHRLAVRHCGETPMQTVVKLRMRRADALLRETDDPIKSIAARVGYANAFAFSVAFKRFTGTCPSERRKRAANSRS